MPDLTLFGDRPPPPRIPHHRVVNVRAEGATWDVYVGRGACPRTGKPGRFGNPYTIEEHGKGALRLYVARLDDTLADVVRRARAELPGRFLGCWCAPSLCHGEVLARLADGDPVEVIRADVLAWLEQEPAPRRRRREERPDVH